MSRRTIHRTAIDLLFANPAVQVREFRLALDLRTAKALGIVVPQTIRVQVNDLVE